MKEKQAIVLLIINLIASAIIINSGVYFALDIQNMLLKGRIITYNLFSCVVCVDDNLITMYNYPLLMVAIFGVINVTLIAVFMRNHKRIK